DGRLSLAFDRPVEDAAGVGSNGSAAPTFRLGDYLFRTRLTAIELQLFDPATNSWSTVAAPTATKKLYGAWQTSGDATEGNRRLLLWVRTAYEWSRVLDQPNIAQLEQAQGFDRCEPMMPTKLTDFDAAADVRLPALRS